MKSRQQSAASRPSRRSVLALLGAAPLAGTATLAMPEAARAASGRSDAIPAPIPGSLRPGGQFDRYVAQLAAEDKFSGNVLLVHRDRPVLSRSYGMANKEKSIPNQPDTIFALGSITKVFTGLAVMQLVAENKIVLTEKLGTYLDGFSARAADVTIHQLLTHTSGFGDYMQLSGFGDQVLSWNSVPEYWNGCMSFVRKETPAFTPGNRFQYSNAGFFALGAVVAEVSGQSYYDYVREHIFRPAGMGSGDFYTRPQWISDRRIAHPYSTQNTSKRTDVASIMPFVGSPDGEAFATADDLARFVRALLGGKLLAPAFVEALTSPKFPTLNLPAKPGLSAKWGFEAYGPETAILNDQRIISHGGAAPGVCAYLAVFPDSDWIEVNLSNYDVAPDIHPIDSLAEQLITAPHPTS